MPTELPYAELIASGWRTQDSYYKQYEMIPDESGVYMITAITDRPYGTPTTEVIAYIGMSKRLSSRHKAHPITKELYRQKYYCRVFFKRFPTEKIRVIERELIHKYNPPYNIIGKRRGI
jgi:excinuclease UvrABC nuclease subunit